MVNMQRPAEPGPKESMLGMEAESKPHYPYGLEISLGDPELTKLGVAELPAPGSTLMMTCKVQVTRTSTHSSADDDGGKAERHVALQITDMELGGQAAKPLADRMYGG